MQLSILDLPVNTSYGLRKNLGKNNKFKTIDDLFRDYNSNYTVKLESQGVDIKLEKMIDIMFYNFSRLGYTDLFIADFSDEDKKSQVAVEKYIRNISLGLIDGKAFANLSNMSKEDILDWGSYILTSKSEFITGNDNLSQIVKKAGKITKPKVKSGIANIYSKIPTRMPKHVKDTSFIEDRGGSINLLHSDMTFRGVQFVNDLTNNQEVNLDDVTSILSRDLMYTINNYYELAFGLSRDVPNGKVKRTTNSVVLNKGERLKVYSSAKEGIPRDIFVKFYKEYGDLVLDQVKDVRRGKYVYQTTKKTFPNQDLAFVYSILNFGNIYPLRDNDVLNYNRLDFKLQDEIRNKLRSVIRFQGKLNDNYKHADINKDGFIFKDTSTDKLIVPVLYSEIAGIIDSKIDEVGTIQKGFAQEVVKNARRYFTKKREDRSYIVVPKRNAEKFSKICQAAGYSSTKRNFESTRSAYFRIVKQ